MTPIEFAEKWEGSRASERAAAQEHFIDICDMLGLPTPNSDPSGQSYAFEKGAEKTSGGDGFADVWKRGFFGWEYKGKRKNLAAAYDQLLQYREALENPPLLVVCDINRFEIHTNFTGTVKTVHRFSLSDLKTDAPQHLHVLLSVMTDPDKLRPTRTPEEVTEEVAGEFAELAERLRSRGHDAHAVARFLSRLLFCLFAEDTKLLPDGVLSRILSATPGDAGTVHQLMAELFTKMSTPGGGYFGAEHIQWFNGGLFADATALPLEKEDIRVLATVSALDWSNIEPAILGTLFERGLNPSLRGQLGAHYTDKASIERVIEPVMIRPLRQEFDAMKRRVETLLARGKTPTARAKGKDNPNRVFRDFLDRLRRVRVLDPACGSGNFLYLALRALKDLEKEVILWGAHTLKMTQELPGVTPEVLRGIEINDYAAELARVVIWIGEIQWMLANGFSYLREPVLRPMRNIEERDALLDLTDAETPRMADWPAAEFIIGNPPFLGGKKLRTELGDEYVDALFSAWRETVPPEADLVAYWHERARQMIAQGRVKRAGLLATQGIRNGVNQRVLRRITESGAIFAAWSDLPWVVEGANVRISIICQDNGTEEPRSLDGQVVQEIRADLSGGSPGGDATLARRLSENMGMSFMGDTKGGPFDIGALAAEDLLRSPAGVNGRPHSDVVVPWVNGLDIVRRPRDMYIIDFGVSMTEEDAAKYEGPFEQVKRDVRPVRALNAREVYREKWWLHVEPRPALRAAVSGLSRFIATARVAKHRVFVWLHPPVLPDSQVIVVARDDWFTFGILQSRVHVVWALKKGSRLESRPRYTPTSTFETFPFPWPLATPAAALSDGQTRLAQAVATAAEELDTARQRWLNPQELTRRIAGLAPGFPDRLVPIDDAAAKVLGKRTLTALYNAAPTWLTHAHAKLDLAVLAAYGWTPPLDDDSLVRNLLSLNLQRQPSQSDDRADSDIDADTDVSDDE